MDFHSEVIGGLENEKGRLENALDNANFYRGIFPDDSLRRSSTTDWEGARFRRDSRIMEWLVSTLAADLYAHGPTRVIADQPEATAWLGAIYKASGTDALLQSADQWAAVSQVAGVQVIATEDPSRPVRHILWPAHQLVVWDSPEDPLAPAAVATIDSWDNARRLRLWTPERLSTYATDKLRPGQTAGGTAYRLMSTQDNPFGVIPFAFVHYHFPTTEFWSGGPGDNFRELNDYINFALTEVGDSLRYCSKPIVKLRNVRSGWKPNTPVRPGDLWNLPGDPDADGLSQVPDAEYFQCDLGFVEANWSDIQSLLDHSMQCADVPPAAFRMVQDSARSGLSIVAERMPLVQRAERRQRPANSYERELARLTCLVGSKHLGANSAALGDDAMKAGAARLAEAAARPDLCNRWPSMKSKLTGQDAILEDQARLKEGMKSRTQILIERDDMTREEAEAYLEQTAKDLERERKLLQDSDPAGPTPVHQTPPPAKPGPVDPPDTEIPEEDE